MKNKLVVGLTGGIGSGKSTVAKLFYNLGVDIIDADKIARDVVSKGSSALELMKKHFGVNIIEKSGGLNRAVLRKRIFDNAEDKKWLENLLHPIIRKKMQKLIGVSTSDYCIAIIPLLFETKINFPLTRVLVIDTTEEHQIQCTMSRDKIPREAVLKIMSAQVPRKTRLQNADDIIENTGDFSKLKEQVNKQHENYLRFQ